jgi:hypothetical protein
MASYTAEIRRGYTSWIILRVPAEAVGVRGSLDLKTAVETTEDTKGTK